MGEICPCFFSIKDGRYSWNDLLVLFILLAYLTDGRVLYVLYNIIITLLKPLKTRTGGQGQRTSSFRITTAIAHLSQVRSLIKPEFLILNPPCFPVLRAHTLLGNTKQNFEKQNKIF